MMEIEVNNNRYALEIDSAGNVSMRRYRSDFKIWVTVYFGTDRNLDKKVQSILQEVCLNSLKIKDEGRDKHGE